MGDSKERVEKSQKNPLAKIDLYPKDASIAMSAVELSVFFLLFDCALHFLFPSENSEITGLVCGVLSWSCCLFIWIYQSYLAPLLHGKMTFFLFPVWLSFPIALSFQILETLTVGKISMYTCCYLIYALRFTCCFLLIYKGLSDIKYSASEQRLDPRHPHNDKEKKYL
jgi:hypothetical protein